MPERKCNWCGKTYPFYEDHDSVECRDALVAERDALRVALSQAKMEASIKILNAEQKAERAEAALLSIEAWAHEQLGGVVPAHFILNRVRDARAALRGIAPAEKAKTRCCDCPPGLRWQGHYGEGLCYCACHLPPAPAEEPKP
jgi:hypothetical protein